MNNPFSEHPEPSDYVAAFGRYVALVPEGDILDTLSRQNAEVKDLLSRVGEEKANYSYAPGKWSLKEVANHFTDSERVFAYRALSIGRGDAQPLPGFDENLYAAHAGVAGAELSDILDEFEALRRASVLFFRLLPEAAWSARGVANKAEITVRALAWVMAGHVAHHIEVLRSRYLSVG
jgi:hypothetical protein